ncbi:MAG: hypothetical protein KBA81_08350 [Rhabdochlamydiaceae bacterium]|nr:hypothetical protein [Rhabdochlamydiaceae bacterium]
MRLLNDTAYKLRAVIRAADGTYLGEVIVMPQRTMQWNDYWGGIGYYNNSQTPYTVIWFCVDGGDFSVCNNVPSGGTVTAFSCDGTRQCRPQQKKQNPDQYGPPTEEYLPEQLEQQGMENEAGPPQGMVQ